jgi:hypothetical protein
MVGKADYYGGLDAIDDLVRGAFARLQDASDPRQRRHCKESLHLETCLCQFRTVLKHGTCSGDGRLTILGEGADFDRAGRRRRLPDIIHIELLELALI